jgi:hypothetical protein
MATPNVTPNPGGTSPTGDAGASSSPNAATQPHHSSDRALANFNSNDPAKGGAAPPTGDNKTAAATGDGAATAATGTPAAGDGSLDNLVKDLGTILGDDLTAIADDKTAATAATGTPAATIDPNDPLAAVKDVPRFQELVKAEETIKGLLTKSEYVKEAAHIEAAIADAEVLWQIVDGKADVSAILDAAKTQSPQAFPKLLESLRAYVAKETGVPIAAAAAGQVDPANMTPEQKELAAIRKTLADREAIDKKRDDDVKRAAFVKRVETVKTDVMAKIPELLKDTVFDGETEHFFALAGNLLRPQEMQLIEAVEKKDFKLIESAVKRVRSQEAVRFSERVKRAIELQKKKSATIPKQATGGDSGASADAGANKTPVTSSTEERRKQMAANLKNAG